MGLKGNSLACLRVFDFDDTLANTDAKVWVTNAQGVRSSLTPAEFAIYDRRSGDVFDYVEFRQLINPRPIARTCQILQQAYDRYGPIGLAVLSARSTPEPIHQFLGGIGLSGIEVVALDNASPTAKAEWVDRWIRERNLRCVKFFDDSSKNIAAIEALRQFHPNVRIITLLVRPRCNDR